MLADEVAAISAMSRNAGRAPRARSPGAESSAPEAPQPQPMARWTDERLVIVVDAVMHSPAALFRVNPNWGKPVPAGKQIMHKYCIHHHLIIISRTFHVSGRLRVAKNRIENLEYNASSSH